MTSGRAARLWCVLVSLLAALIGMGLLLWLVDDSGPLITISFLDAEGLESGRTPVRYRDVDVGIVTAVHLSPDRKRVLASVRLARAAAGLAVADTHFWIVRPRVESRGISGVGTLLVGSYVGLDAGLSHEAASAFTGLEGPPAVTHGQRGTRYVLRARSQNSIEAGAPVYYRHVDVGRVTAVSLDPDGKGVSIDVFIDAPYHRYIVANTRWWNASGCSLWLDARGLSVSMQSLTGMWFGAVAFQPVTGQSPGAQAPTGMTFVLAENERIADEPPTSAPAVVVMRFAPSLRGLSVGATVDFRGLALGEVTKIEIEHDVGKREPVMLVTMSLYPDRLGQQFRDSAEHVDAVAGRALLRKLVDDGLRGQLRTGNLLTNQLYVALDMFPHALPVRLDLVRSPVELPTVPNALDDLQAEISQMLHTLDRVPFGPVGSELSRSFVRARRLFKLANAQLVPQGRETLGAAKQLLDDAEADLHASPSQGPDFQPAREHLNQALQALGVLSGTLEQRAPAP
ncbi:Intermembrane transport protein PqiB [Ralstonia psammae]|uniref:Intermembrane transport protein PqiB n=1 Tax=Ralstonia psammae TaxID=3058598 RepID=A0ABN9JDW6_9RALS|nr:MlaD family protein [Ralstonia sp. LMG 19083]CAJ0808436.1 Intermembrane transport protein PqiB [Ralstonia sp. LMG 19083]